MGLARAIAWLLGIAVVVVIAVICYRVFYKPVANALGEAAQATSAPCVPAPSARYVKIDEATKREVWTYGGVTRLMKVKRTGAFACVQDGVLGWGYPAGM